MAEVPRVNEISHLQVSPRRNRHLCAGTPLISGYLWLVERFGVGCTAKVLVEGLLENGHVPLHESFMPFVHEFDLWGIGAGHRDGRREFSETVGAQLKSSRSTNYIRASARGMFVRNRSHAPHTSSELPASQRGQTTCSINLAHLDNRVNPLSPRLWIWGHQIPFHS